MKTPMRKFALIFAALPMLAACQDAAKVAAHNMTKAADNFEIMRRVVFYNSISDKIIMVTEGKCSVEAAPLRTAIICKVGEGQYIRNFYGKSDNTVYFVEQMAPVPVNLYHYRRTFKPQGILPDIDFRGDLKALGQSVMPDKKD